MSSRGDSARTRPLFRGERHRALVVRLANENLGLGDRRILNRPRVQWRAGSPGNGLLRGGDLSSHQNRAYRSGWLQTAPQIGRTRGGAGASDSQ